MQVLLEILLETLILIGFLWIGKSVMKAQVYTKHLLIAALAGALASQVPFVGVYLSFGVVLFFMWKMARVDMVPDGVLIVVIGKGAGLIMMVYGVALFMDHSDNDKIASLAEMPIYQNQEGLQYFAEGKDIYFRDDNGERVYVDATEIYGISEMMELANDEAPPVMAEAEITEPEAGEVVASIEEEIEEVVAVESVFETLISDSVVRGQNLPFEIFVPRGWMVSRSPESVAIGYEGQTYLRCFAGSEESDNKSYLRSEVNRILNHFLGYEIMRQELVTIDGKQWARLQFINEPGDQILLMTHSSKVGSYTIELKGTFRQLSENLDMLNRIMYSFNFPPTTYFLAQAEASE